MYNRNFKGLMKNYYAIFMWIGLCVHFYNSSMNYSGDGSSTVCKRLRDYALLLK